METLEYSKRNKSESLRSPVEYQQEKLVNSEIEIRETQSHLSALKDRDRYIKETKAAAALKQQEDAIKACEASCTEAIEKAIKEEKNN